MIAVASNDIWTQTKPNTFVTEASTVTGRGGSRRVPFPGTTLSIADLKWTTIRDSEGEITHWTRLLGNRTFIIWND